MTSTGFPALAAVSARVLLCSSLVLLAACASSTGSGISSASPSSALPDMWQVPSGLTAKLEALEPAQQTFISSGEFLTYMPARQMELELASRDTEGMQALLGDLMGVAAEMTYDPARDMGAIPLNLTARGYNYGIVLPAILRKEVRSPGPVGVHRYMFPTSGVPTFAGAPVAIYPEDLVAGNVEVAIVGIPNDMSSGRRNSKAGPRTMRALDTIGTPDIQTLLDPLAVLSVVDYGDFAVDSMSNERTVVHVTEMVAETAGTGAVPMMVGGDTSMLYPGVKGVAQVQGQGSFGLVHFSAHPDANRQGAHTISDDQALFRLIDEGIVDGAELITVGLRGEAVNPDTLQWLRSEGVRYHTMAAVNRNGYDVVMDSVIADLDALPEQIFVSIDVSVIDPGDMVAAGRVAANGLSIQNVSATIRHLCAARDIVGFEITDLAPMLDYSRLSAVNANAVLNACLNGMAARKAGFAPDEIHPLALEHGQN